MPDFQVYGAVTVAPDGAAEIGALDASLKKIRSSGATAASGIAAWGASMTAAGAKVSALGRTMTTHLTLPIVAIGVVSAKMSMDFSAAMDRIHTQAGASQQSVASLTKGVINLGLHGQSGPKQLADALYHLKSIGMGNAAAMDALKVAEQGAAVGGSDLETTTNAIGGAWKSGIVGAGSFSQAMGTLNAIVGAGNLRMEDLNSALGTGIAMSAKTFGVSLISLGAGLATLTAQGQPATQSATRLRMAISLMGAPSAKAAKELATVGLSTTQLAAALRSGGLVAAVGLLKQHLEGLSKIQQSQILSGAFGGARSGTTIMALVQGYTTLAAKQKQIAASTSKFNADVAAQAQTVEAKWHTFTATLQTAGVVIGNQVIPILSGLVSHVAGFVSAIASASPGTISLAVHMAALAAAAGPVVLIIGKLMSVAGMVGTGISTMVGTIGQLTAAAGLAEGGVAAFGSTLLTALGPAGITMLAVAGIAAVSYGIYRLVKALDTASASTKIEQTALKELHGPGGSQLQAWSDKVLGGHVVSKAGQITWQPAVKVDVNAAKAGAITKMIQTEAAQEHAAKAEALQQSKIDNAKAAEAIAEGAALKIAAEARAAFLTGGKAASAKYAPQYAAAVADAQRYGSIVDQLTGKLRNMKGVTDKALVIKASIADFQSGIKKAQTQLDALTKKKQTATVVMQEQNLKNGIAAAKSQIADLTSKNHVVLIEAKIQTVQSQLANLQAHLKQLDQQKSTPKIDADKAVLVKAIASAKAKLAALNKQKTQPTVTLNDQASQAAANLRQRLLTTFQSPITQTVNITTVTKTVKHARGGVFTTPHIGMVAESGPEAIVPLNDPARAASVMQSAGLSAGPDASSSRGASSVASSAAKIANAAANAVSKGMHGLSSKTAKKATNAAAMSGSIGTLVDFVNSMTTALQTLATSTVPTLATGWQANVKKIVDQVIQVGEVVAAEINKAYKWTKGNAKKSVSPAMDSKGTATDQASQMTGPLAALVQFVADISATVTTLNTGIPALNAGATAAAKSLVDSVIGIAQAIGADLTGSKATQVMADNAAILASVVSPITDMITVVTAMNAGIPEVTAAAQTGAKALVDGVIAIANAIGTDLTNSGATQAMADAMGVLGNIMSPITQMIDGLNSLLGWAGGQMSSILSATNQMCDMIVQVVGIMNSKLGGLTLSDSIVTVLSAVASAMSSITSIQSAVAAGGGGTSSSALTSSYQNSVYYNMTVNTRASQSSVMNDFATMRAIYGTGT